jgi:hypothetical protein
MTDFRQGNNPDPNESKFNSEFFAEKSRPQRCFEATRKGLSHDEIMAFGSSFQALFLSLQTTQTPVRTICHRAVTRCCQGNRVTQKSLDILAKTLGSKHPSSRWLLREIAS